jgi:small neutral amino acid transporter SnatA (MarC family)
VSAGVVFLAALACVNPARVALGMPDAPLRRRLVLLGAGSGLAILLAAVGLAVADPLLDALDISPESLRIATGAVLLVAGARTLVVPRPAAEPAARLQVLVPVLFPLLVTPELALVLLGAGADERNAAAVAGIAAALLLALAGTLVERTPVATALFVQGSRLLGAVLVLAGVAYVVDGIRDV